MSFEILKSIEVIVGLGLALFGFIAGCVGWIWKRMADHVRGQIAPLGERGADFASRLSQVEMEQAEVSARATGLEQRMNSLATKDDVQQLALSLVRNEERGIQTAGKVDTLYRAVMERSRRE